MGAGASKASAAMRVVIPFVPPPPGCFEHWSSTEWKPGLMPETEVFGRRVGARFVDTSSSDFRYYELMRELWSEGETFIIVEHNVVPDDDLIADLWSCSQDYCSISHSLACVKFGAGLVRRWPSLFEEMVPMRWGQVDTYIREGLEGGEHIDRRVVLSSPGCGVRRHLHRVDAWHRGGGHPKSRRARRRAATRSWAVTRQRLHYAPRRGDGGSRDPSAVGLRGK